MKKSLVSLFIENKTISELCLKKWFSISKLLIKHHIKKDTKITRGVMKEIRVWREMERKKAVTIVGRNSKLLRKWRNRWYLIRIYGQWVWL